MSAYACAIFLGAFLLFQIQPILAKAILPWFGGAPAVWTTCMLFFQSLLLVGYAYAHASARLLRPRMQGGLHLVLLVMALCFLPVAPAESGKPTGSMAPVLEILALLSRSVALPFLLLSASSPLLQAWSALGRGRTSPYRLYALSNAGSMLALLTYPVVIEPWLTTRWQEYVWSAAFGGFAVLCALSVRGLWHAAPPVAAGLEDPAPEAPPGLRQRLLWLALPACAATLLLAVTNQMCQEVAVVPLLWVLPLSVYLLSFILCFASDRWYGRSWCIPVLVLALIVMTQALALGPRVGILYAVPVYSIGLFVCCMFCHGELAARRPSARHLTSFYLMIAVGGALGGAFVTVLAPFLFRGFDELYVGLLACGTLAAGFSLTDPAQRIAGRRLWNPIQLWLGGVVLVIALAFGTRLMARAQPGLRELRNFYGIMRIADLPAPDGKGTLRFLTHGGTRHGQQFQDPERRRLPTTYYGHSCGIGILLDELPKDSPRRVGIVGLGAGILAAYGRPGDTYRFYEINPLVIEVARRDFSFLSDSSATLELVPGDARLSLEREEDQRFDVLVLDAFSSDAIPTHLLTLEAFKLYGRHLAADGVLALHVTTRHLDLGPLVAALAQKEGKAAFEILTPANEDQGILGARWILVTTHRERLAHPRLQAAGQALEVGAEPPRLWTDDYSNLLQVLK
jgi:SAM-dependent methyltransferase